MSGTFDALHWVRRVQVPATEKALLYAISSYVDEHDECYPSQATLAGDAGMGERTVRRLLASFEDRGLISRTARRSPDGRGRTSDRIKLHVGWMPGVLPANMAGTSDVQPATCDDQPAKSDTFNRPLTTDQPATGGRGTTRELPIELPEEQRANSLFDAFWTAYPRKVGKPSAIRAFDRATKRAEGQTIIDGLDRWVAYWRAAATKAEFIPHAATWLNDDRWDADVPKAPRGARAQRPESWDDAKEVAW